MTGKHKKKHGVFYRHSLSIVTGAFLLLWIGLYRSWNPATHWGSFFGNAIADWSGAFLMIFATKFLYEKGSAESRRLPKTILRPALELLRDHSLSIFLLITGIGWLVLFRSMNPESRWGQVVGNIVSEWTQVFMLVLMTKRLVEKRSKESKPC